MFTITNRIRAIVAIGAVGAVLGSASVASAALPVHQLGTVRPALVSQPTATAQYIDPSNVDSAGIPGYDRQACEDLAGAFNEAWGMAQQQIALEQAAGPYTQAGQDAAAAAKSYSNDASAYQQELNDNCLVVD